MKKVTLVLLSLACLTVGTIVFAQGATAQVSGVGIGRAAAQVTSNLANIAKLFTAAAYVAGMAFVIGALVKFKAHKDNPTQIPLGTPVALMLIGAGLMFSPTLFKYSGQTLFGTSGRVAGISGITYFGVQKQGQ